MNPATDEKVCEVWEAAEEDVDQAVAAAQKAFPSWSNLNAFERARPLAALAALIQREADELAELEALCMGK